jgi:pimeloyl-ACP methyl ester carboxylesterase
VDVARFRLVPEFQVGPTIVAGHSYGGQITTALGTNAPNAVGLVYVAAFGLDEGRATPSGSSRRGWGQRRWRSHRAMLRWCRTPRRSLS